MSAAQMQRRSPVQHVASGAIRSARAGASPEPIQHRHASGIASLPGHAKVLPSPLRDQSQLPTQLQPQPQQQPSQPQQHPSQPQPRSASVRRVVQAGEQPYWQYSGYQTPESDDTEGHEWDEFFSVLHNRPYCETATRAVSPRFHLAAIVQLLLNFRAFRATGTHRLTLQTVWENPHTLAQQLAAARDSVVLEQSRNAASSERTGF